MNTYGEIPRTGIGVTSCNTNSLLLLSDGEVDMSSIIGAERDNTISITDSNSDSGTNTLVEIEKRVEERVGRAGRRAWRFLHELPGHGAVLGGAAGLAGVLFVVSILSIGGLGYSSGLTKTARGCRRL